MFSDFHKTTGLTNFSDLSNFLSRLIGIKLVVLDSDFLPIGFFPEPVDSTDSTDLRNFDFSSLANQLNRLKSKGSVVEVEINSSESVIPGLISVWNDSERVSGYIGLLGQPVKDPVLELSNLVPILAGLFSRLASCEAAASASGIQNLISGIGHDIRTPMTGIIGFTDLLIDSETDSERLEMLRMLRVTEGIMLRSIHERLNYYRLDSGLISSENTVFDLNVLLMKLEKSMINVTSLRELELNIEFDGSQRSVLTGDSEKLEQVLEILLEIAVLANSSKIINLQVQKSFDVEERSGGIYKFAVFGIDQAFFEPVVEILEGNSKASTSTVEPAVVNPVSLGVAQKLVEFLGGELKFGKISQSDKFADKFADEFGFSFELHFNLAETGNDLPVTLNQPPVKEESKKALFSGTSILVVEDNRINRLVLEAMLNKHGFSVDFACDGVQAVEMYQDKNYPLIIMDIQMPRMNGYQASKRIKELAEEFRRPDVKIIALTARFMDQDREMVRASGMDDFIEKPPVIEVLLDKISRLLKD